MRCCDTAIRMYQLDSIQLNSPPDPQHFYDEIQGFADGAGVDPTIILHLNMIPELVKAACSMFGAWGPATAKSTAVHTIHTDFLSLFTRLPGPAAASRAGLGS